MEIAVTEFIVKNEEPYSQVAFAYLTIVHTHGRTVRLTPWQWITRTLLLPTLPHTRHVPLDDDAEITMEDGERIAVGRSW